MKKLSTILLLAICSTGVLKAQTQLTFYTNFGDFQSQLYDSIVPITTGNFINLATTKSYDGKKFYRVKPNFVIQGGTWPTLNPPIADEFDSTGTLSNTIMTLSMANSGPNTGSSEFFVNLKNNSFLDYDKSPLSSAHPVFGIVKSGWSTVDSIAGTPTDANDAPLSDVIIDSIRVTGSYLAVEEIERMKTVTQIYPNPISSQSILDLYNPEKTEVIISLITGEGKMIKQETYLLNSGKTKIPLSSFRTENLPNGVYFLQIKSNEGLVSEKFIVSW